MSRGTATSLAAPAAPRSVLEIDLAAITSNLAVIRRVLAKGASSAGGRPASVCAVVKADGYGLGAVKIAKRIANPHYGGGVEMLAVYTAEQARTLVEAAVGIPILILGPVHDLGRQDALYHALSRGLVHLTIHDPVSCRAVAALADKLGVVVPVHVEIDTGMTRAGVSLEHFPLVMDQITRNHRLRLAGLTTHFSSADSSAETTKQQATAFYDTIEAHQADIPADCTIHTANTAALFRAGGLHADMVRVGLAIYGYGAESLAEPDEFQFAGDAKRLKPCARWTTRVVQIKAVGPDTPVGYGADYHTPEDREVSLLATLPVGYADGYPMGLAGKGRVGFGVGGGVTGFGTVVGRVSMDQIVVDVTGLPDGAVRIGSEAELIGRDPGAPNHLPKLARAAGTIPHELMCRVGRLVERTYLSGESASPPRARSTAL